MLESVVLKEFGVFKDWAVGKSIEFEGLFGVARALVVTLAAVRSVFDPKFLAICLLVLFVFRTFFLFA